MLFNTALGDSVRYYYAMSDKQKAIWLKMEIGKGSSSKARQAALRIGYTKLTGLTARAYVKTPASLKQQRARAIGQEKFRLLGLSGSLSQAVYHAVSVQKEFVFPSGWHHKYIAALQHANNIILNAVEYHRAFEIDLKNAAVGQSGAGLSETKDKENG